MKLGPYEVLGQLGRGGMGVVLRARGPDGKDVALKLLERSDARAVERFERERRLLAALGTNEGFVPLLDAGMSDRGPYVVLPFVAGGTLRDRLKDKVPLAVDEALDLAKALAAAMAVAHAKGIVHRDLKPENILYTADGRPLVSDLGLAKHFRSDLDGASQSRGLTKTGEGAGTVAYMAPEQAIAAKTVTPSADVFSLAAILYECLAGDGPFESDSTLAIVAAAAEGRFEPLAKRRPDVPRWLAHVVERGLAPDPERRFRDAQAFLDALDQGRDPAARGGRLVAAAVVLAVGGAGAFLATRGGVPVPTVPPPSTTPVVPVVARPPTAPPPAPTPGAPSDDARRRAVELVAEASRALELKRHAQVHELAEKALDADPSNAQALALRGAARTQLGDARGIEDLDAAVAKAPDHALIRLWRGVVRAKRRETAQAIEDLDRATALDPASWAAFATRAGVRSLAGLDLDKAIEDATRALELQPRAGSALFNRSAAYRKKRDFARSLADLDRLIELEPRSLEAYDDRSLLRLNQGDLEGALADSTKAIELDPKSVVLLCRRAMIHIRRGAFSPAVQDTQRAVDLEPQNDIAWGTHASALGQKGDYKEAIAAANKTIELDPKEPSGWVTRGRVRELTNDKAGAAADYDEYLKLAGDAPDAAAIRARKAALKRDDD